MIRLIGELLFCVVALMINFSHAVEFMANEAVYDLLPESVIASTGAANLEGASEHCFSSDSRHLFVTSTPHSALYIFTNSQPDISADSWQLVQVITANENCLEQICSPAIPAIKGASGLGWHQLSGRLVVLGRYAGAAVVFQPVVDNNSNSTLWQPSQVISAAGSQHIESPGRLSFSEEGMKLNVISASTGMIYIWRFSRQNLSWIHEQNKNLAGEHLWQLRQILSFRNGVLAIAAVVPGSAQLRGGLLIVNPGDTGSGIIMSYTSADWPALDSPSDMAFARDQQQILITASRQGGSLLVISRINIQQHNWHLDQVFGVQPVNAVELTDIDGASAVVVGTPGTSYQYAYVVAGISNTLKVLVRPIGEWRWQHAGMSGPDRDELNQKGISDVALLSDPLPILTTLAAYSKDIRVFAISARPVFYQPQLDYEYNLKSNHSIARINVTFPDDSRLNNIRTDHPGFYLDDNQSLWLDPAWVDEFNEGDDVAFRLIAQDSENQTTTVNSTLYFTETEKDDGFPYTYLAFTGLALLGVVAAAVPFTLAVRHSHKATPGDTDVEAAIQDGRSGISLIQPRNIILMDAPGANGDCAQQQVLDDLIAGAHGQVEEMDIAIEGELFNEFMADVYKELEDMGIKIEQELIKTLVVDLYKKIDKSNAGIAIELNGTDLRDTP